jgi:3D (Asp-Asp-Asp) domain-containing protein
MVSVSPFRSYGVENHIAIGAPGALVIPEGACRMRGRIRLAILALSILPLSAAARPQRHRSIPMKATAYARQGTTASGAKTRRGVIAADPRVLPLGTKVRVDNAGPYSGHYVVKDTGRKIRGRKIDLFMPSRREAQKFGRKDVQVKVVEPAPKRP